MIVNLFGLISVTFLSRCWKICCVQHRYSSTLIKESRTCCILMLACMDGQEYWPKVIHPTVDGKEVTMDHPLSYISGLFCGSQLNWATLTKEAYTMYMSINKSTFHLTGHEITLRSYHLPLKKFLRYGEQLVYWNWKLQYKSNSYKKMTQNIWDLHDKVKEGAYHEFYFVENNVLFRSIVDNSHKFEARVIPKSLVDVVLHLGHNQSGHNGYQRKYTAIKHLYYWKGMRVQILWYCTNCKLCAMQNVQKTQFEKQIFEPGVQLMEFVSMDLIGDFHPPSSKGNRYALTAVCMLTGYTFCIPLKNKSVEETVTSWRNHIIFPFVVCRKLLMDNGTKFKNDLLSRVAEQLGVERRIYSPPYRLQSNGKIEGFHKFLKSCLAKHISRHREWDDVVPLATVSYNWLPNQHSKESPFFIMFGRDAVTNLSQLTKPKLRYMGTEDLILDLELMSSIFQT